MMGTSDLIKAVMDASPSIQNRIEHVLTGRPDETSDTDWRTCTHVEAGERLGVSRQMVHKMVNKGLLETRVIGRSNRVLIRSIDAYMRNPTRRITNRKWQPHKNKEG